MSKRKIVLVGLGVLGLLGLLGILGREKKDVVSPEGSLLGNVEQLRPTPVEEVLYEDESGFSFKLPANLVVEDRTEEVGDEYYTLLEIRGDQPRTTSVAGFGDKGKIGEKIRVAIRDTKYKSVGDWLEKDEKAPKGAKLAGAVGLDEIPAKQYAKDNKIWTVAIDLGALYLIEGVKDGGNLEATYNRLVETFKFRKPEAEKGSDTSAGGGSAGGGNVIYEAEEVVQ